MCLSDASSGLPSFPAPSLRSSSRRCRGCRGHRRLRRPWRGQRRSTPQRRRHGGRRGPPAGFLPVHSSAIFPRQLVRRVSFAAGALLGLSAASIPILWATLNLSKVIWAYLGGDLADRMPRAQLSASGWLVYLLVYLGLGAATAVWHVWVIFALYGVFLWPDRTRRESADQRPRPVARATAAPTVYNFVIGSPPGSPPYPPACSQAVCGASRGCLPPPPGLGPMAAEWTQTLRSRVAAPLTHP
jgi:hypothetical protein